MINIEREREKHSPSVRVAPKSRHSLFVSHRCCRRISDCRTSLKQVAHCVSVEAQRWHETKKCLSDVSVEVQMRLQFLLSENAWKNTRTLAPCLTYVTALVTLELKLFA